jgi:uncharacterized protein (TIGR03437 family)
MAVTADVGVTPAQDDGRPSMVSVGSDRGVTATGVIAPGQLLTIHGRHLGGRVLLDGKSAQVVWAGENEIGVVVPEELTESEVNVEVEHFGRRTEAVRLPVVSANPTILGTNPFGKGNAEAQNEDSMANDAEHPAARGSVVTLFATGLSVRSLEGFEVHVGGRPAEIVSARQSGTRPGIVEVRIRVPDVERSSFQPTVLHVGNQFSAPGIGIAVR